MTEVTASPVSTFSVDVDTASYSRARSALLAGNRPDPATVRVEEMVNYFRYDLPRPADPARPFSVLTDVTKSPWNADSLVLRVALRGYDVSTAERPPANLVFLIDVSGSMGPDDRLPLIKRALSSLAEEMRPQDRISLVTYAGTAGVALKSTSDADAVQRAIASLEAGGSTAGGDGLRLAYDQARRGFVRNGINRVLIASDGDFNVGETDTGSLKALIAEQRRSGVTLTTLAVGQESSGDANMEALADAGDGNAAYLGSDAEARKVLHDELSSTLQTIAKDVKAQVEFNPEFVSSYRLIGYDDRRLAERDFDDDAVDAGDIGAGHQVTALYEITPRALPASGLAARRRYAPNRNAPEDAGSAGGGGEALFVKLRYKLPQGGQSILLQQPVAVSALAAAGAPAGDTAFALSVASFGQYLAGTPGIGGFGPADMQRLAGRQTDPTRAEFVSLLGRLPGGVPVSGLPDRSSSRAAAPDGELVITQEAASPADRTGPGDVLAWLALFAGIAAAAWHWMRRKGPASPDAGSDRKDVAEAEKTDRLAATIRLARSDSMDPETEKALAVLDNVGHRAKVAAGPDPDIAVEVEAVLDRHLPGYVDDYVQSRRRAAPARAAELEEAFRRTVEMMTDRLRALLDAQSRRDVERLGDHERFLAGRHMPDQAG
jgi:Ca-activated chloride channel family protein